MVRFGPACASSPIAAILPALNGNVARIPRRTRAIDDPAVADHNIIRLSESKPAIAKRRKMKLFIYKAL